MEQDEKLTAFKQIYKEHAMDLIERVEHCTSMDNFICLMYLAAKNDILKFQVAKKEVHDVKKVKEFCDRINEITERRKEP